MIKRTDTQLLYDSVYDGVESIIKEKSTGLLYSEKPKFIAVAGPSSGGKGVFSKTLCERLNEIEDSCAGIIKSDNYIFGKKEMKNLPIGSIEWPYDHPACLDWELFKQHITDLAEKKDIEIPQYNFAISDRIGSKKYSPKKINILDGLWLLNKKKSKELFDKYALKIYVDAFPEIRLGRRQVRDKERAKKSFIETERIFNEFVEPNCKTYIQPTEKYADIIIINNSPLPEKIQEKKSR